MLKAWTDAEPAGLLDRFGERGSAFAYLPNTPPQRAVSVTMPVRLASWNAPFGLAPIFDMNLPEGALRERLRLTFAKATGTFDELDLLTIVGRSQVGRIRYTGQNEQLDQAVPFQSVEEILHSARGEELFRYLVEKFATFSGISGVQPKILVRDESALDPPLPAEGRLSQSYRGATHIVKFWDPKEYPQLAANEYFCLNAAKRCGLDVPQYRLAENAMALVVDRFDLRPDGTYRGFEDFCVLNGRTSDQKYRGSYESSVLKRFEQFARSPELLKDLEKLFTLIALNCAIRNGDAHLKNFGVTYDDVLEESPLAPVYDLVTTTVYLQKDAMALSLNGTTAWPAAKALQKLGETRMRGTPAQIRQILQRISDALCQTSREIQSYIKDHPEFGTIGVGMLKEWEKGIQHSLALP
jgi:serine/threonine-protein kinase HipA